MNEKLHFYWDSSSKKLHFYWGIIWKTVPYRNGKRRGSIQSNILRWRGTVSLHSLSNWAYFCKRRQYICALQCMCFSSLYLSCWMRRALTTRSRISALDSPLRCSDSFSKGTGVISTWRSIQFEILWSAFLSRSYPNNSECEPVLTALIILTFLS